MQARQSRRACPFYIRSPPVWEGIALRSLRSTLANAALAACAFSAQAGTVALTFDDLPVFGTYHSAQEGEAITNTLLAGFAHHY